MPLEDLNTPPNRLPILARFWNSSAMQGPSETAVIRHVVGRIAGAIMVA
jgi:hypothetical protein